MKVHWVSGSLALDAETLEDAKQLVIISQTSGPSTLLQSQQELRLLILEVKKKGSNA